MSPSLTVRTPTTDLLEFSSNDLFWLFVFLSYSFGVEKTNTFINALVVPLKPYPISDHNGQNLYPFSDQNGSKTIPFGAAHTYIADIGEYRPPPPPPREVFALIQIASKTT